MDHGNPEAFDQFFDFDQATVENGQFNVTPFGEEQDVDMSFDGLCPVHPNTDCFCPNVIGNWNEFQNSPSGYEPKLLDPSPAPETLISAADIEALNAITAQDYSNFPQWIPRWQRPPRPCDYCRARRLDCFVTLSEGEPSPSELPGCNSCKALFRPCSLQTGSNPNATGGFLDTLHSVSEDTVQDQGFLTGTKPLITLGATYNDVLEDRLERKSGKSLNRFSRATVGILRNWLDTHSEHPYPTDEEKDELKQQTGLKRSQISNWLANARRRGKVRQNKGTSPNSTSSSQPIDIPSEDNRTPFERWKESPPEHEAASINDIETALGYTPGTPVGNSSRSQSNSLRHPTSSGSFSGYKAPSTTSMESIRSWKSGSQGSSWTHGSKSSYNSHAHQDRRRRRRSTTTAPTRQNSVTNQQPARPFQCTFCTDSFQSKYDWTRHEKSLHLSLEKWICAPLGPVIATSSSYQCVYCQEPNPSQAHIESHNHRGCEEKGIAARTFYRKDHLRQHLRLVHSVSMHNSMESWKSAPSYIYSRCGFCGQSGEPEQTFNTWQDRNDHLAKHFRSGAKISQWRGDWGFEPEVAALVTNAMPPFLIGKEAQTMVPFSASNEASMRSHLALTSSNDNGDVRATCWEILTLRLGQFARRQQELGIHITDDMLQQTAREILYGSNDEWNQTAADNEEWLSLFKQAHGIVNETSRRPSVKGSPTIQQQQQQQQLMMYGSENSPASPPMQQSGYHRGSIGSSPHIQQVGFIPSSVGGSPHMQQSGFHTGSIVGSPQLQQQPQHSAPMYHPQVTAAQGLPITQADIFGQSYDMQMSSGDVDMMGGGGPPFPFHMN